MNGRVYDPTLGRFLSPDPAVQTLDNLQGYNRYSYVLNNPFLATDPSGFFFGRLFRAIGKFFKRHAPTILSIAAFVTTNGLVSGQLAPSFGLAKGSFGARLLGTISTNFASSVAGGLAQGASLSDVLRGGLPNIASSLLGAGLDGSIHRQNSRWN